MQLLGYIYVLGSNYLYVKAYDSGMLVVAMTTGKYSTLFLQLLLLLLFKPAEQKTFELNVGM